jgi:hypothetical protein
VLEWTTFADPVSQADWAELSCLLRDRPNLSGPEISQFLNREIGEEDAEKIVENIKGQVAWRRRQMQNGYPFDLSEGNLYRRAEWRDFLPYTFMLLLDTHSYYEKTKIRRWNQIAKLFERLVTQSMRLHLGNAINIGSPRIPTEAPISFQKCIAHICRVVNERKGQPSRIHWHKDGGVDVIGWKKLDERPGKVVFLVQCAAGENWKTKQSVPLKSWSEWIFFATQP